MAMFSESRNTRILGGNFAAVDKGDVHFHVGAIPGQRGAYNPHFHIVTIG